MITGPSKPIYSNRDDNYNAYVAGKEFRCINCGKMIKPGEYVGRFNGTGVGMDCFSSGWCDSCILNKESVEVYNKYVNRKKRLEEIGKMKSNEHQ